MKNKMFEHIRADIMRFHRPSDPVKLSTVNLIRLTPELKTLLVYRMGRWLRNIGRHPL